MQPINQPNSLSGLPEELLICIADSCDRQTLAKLMQLSPLFLKLIQNGNSAGCKSFMLAREIFLLDQHLLPLIPSDIVQRLLGDQDPRKPYIKKISPAELRESDFDALFDSGVDALCDIDVLDNPLLLAKATPTQKSLIERAQKRSKGDLFLYYVPTAVCGNRPTDCYGRRYGNYGLEDDWQVSCSVCIVNKHNDIWPNQFLQDNTKYTIDGELPVALFRGKREGDIVYISLHEREFKLICRQQPYCSSIQNFEDLMLALLSRDGVWSPVNASEPTQGMQRAMIQEAKKQYETSL